MPVKKAVPRFKPRSRSIYFPPNVRLSLQIDSNRKRKSEMLSGEDKSEIYVMQVSNSKRSLLDQEDIDHDNRITIDEDGPKIFTVNTTTGGKEGRETLTGVYNLSVLLQELDYAEKFNMNSLLLSNKLMNESPFLRLLRLIQWWFWPALARHIDMSTLGEALLDEKIQYNLEYYESNRDIIIEEARSVGALYFIDNYNSLINNYIIYVPETDQLGLDYYDYIAMNRKETEKGISVIRLPTHLDPHFAHFLRHFPGLLSLALKQKSDLRYKESNYPCLFMKEPVDPSKSITDIYTGTPFLVPGGRFNEMYGWDSYFILRGLLLSKEMPTSYEDPRNPNPDDLNQYAAHHLKHFQVTNKKLFPIPLICKGIVENLAYQVVNYGKILNANRSYYLMRSQPPFLTDMIISVYSLLERQIHNYADKDVIDTELKMLNDWLTNMTEIAMYEYENVWMSSPRYEESTGLSTYRSAGMRIPPETEPTHFDHFIKPLAEKSGMSIEEYKNLYQYGKIKNEILDKYFAHDRAVRESGHDTSYRLENIAADLCTIDLASLLYKFEMDMVMILDKYYNGGIDFKGTALTSPYAEKGIYTSQYWKKAALKRRELVTKYCWNEEHGMFFDYNYVKKEQHMYESVTTYWPMWSTLATKSQAARLVENIHKFECKGGLSATTEKSRGPLSMDRPPKQWDYPYGWAPHQIIVWEGLVKYDYICIAQRLIYKWCYMVGNSFKNYNGVVSEKYDVALNTFKVFAEYGNVGTEFEYSPKEGFGWTNTSVLIGYSLLTLAQKRSLASMISIDSISMDFQPKPKESVESAQ